MGWDGKVLVVGGDRFAVARSPKEHRHCITTEKAELRRGTSCVAVAPCVQAARHQRRGMIALLRGHEKVAIT